MLLLTAKNIAIFFGLATTAFCISTIVLAVEKADLENDLQDALDKLDMISTASPPTTQTTPSVPSSSETTPAPPSSVTTDSTTGGGSGSSTGSSSTESSSTGSSSTDSSSQGTPTLPSWPTAPGVDPTFPTLPPGLPNPEEVVYRLPREIRPIKYKLYIHPDLVAKTCTGTVSIQIEIDVVTNLIVLNARALKIEGISILNMMARMRIRIKKFYLSEEREMLFIELEELLYTGMPYVVSISYECDLGGLTGIYHSSYLDPTGKSR